jgi:hypothetical protein
MALPAHWKHHIEAWQVSGLSQAAYCRQHGLNTNTFAGRLRDYRSLSKPATPELIPVRLPPQVSPSGALLLRLSSGHQLELPATVAPRWLAELLQCLG